jgi:hypothetical protein
LPRIGRGDSYGLNVHFSLAIDLRGTDERIPLGVLATSDFARPFGSPRLPNGSNKHKPENVMHRWGEQVRAVREHIEGANVIHVMDREADDYLLFSQLVEGGERFVIRQKTDRRISQEEGKSRTIVEQGPLVAKREIVLSERRKSPKRIHASRTPLRAARLTTLEIRSARMTLPRPETAGGFGPASLELNLVEVLEIDTPAGVAPVQWWLWTTEPIANESDVLAVIDAYRARWLIEEYFKALKTGCRFEERQLESQHALLNALAIFSSIAWRLLLLRSVAHLAPTSPGSLALTPLQFRALRGFLRLKRKIELPATADARAVLLAIAKMGGHISNNGDPGWLVIGRGFDRLLDVETGLLLAQEM